MGEADREAVAGYNYPHFDEYVASGGDLADEAAFRGSPRPGTPHRISRCRGWAAARMSGCPDCGGPGRW
jgi:hypothetical protein